MSTHVPKHVLQLASEKTSVYRNGFYISICNSRHVVSVFLMFGAILKVTKILPRKVYHFVVACM